MAGIEQLEIHSKSYIVRWIKVDEGHTLSWSVQPHKKSINFGIVKHPGTGATKLTTFQSDLDESQLDGGSTDGKQGLFSKKDAGTAQEQLRKKGFKLVDWHGKCDADKVTIGTFDVQADNGGMFGLVFDNTFSKQTSKNATFVLLTYPTGQPPQGARGLPTLQAGTAANASRSSLGKNNSPQLGAHTTGSVDSLGSHLAINGVTAGVGGVAAAVGGGLAVGGAGAPAGSISNTGRPVTSAGSSSTTTSHNYHVGTLLKRRRKRGQGYARRFFSLDYATCTFSYYHNRNSSALRGAVPLSLAAVAADERRREITIDSGAEVWHLKASNDREFTDWARALDRASRVARGLEKVPGIGSESSTTHNVNPARAAAVVSVSPKSVQEENREWQQVEALVSRVVGSRDALRRLCKDMAVAGPYAGAAASGTGAQKPHFLSPSTPSVNEEPDDYLSAQPSTSAGGPNERRPFWRRRSSASPLAPSAIRSSVASSLAVPVPSSAHTVTHSTHNHSHEERSMEDHCQALLGDLDSVVTEFTKLLANSKHRRTASAVAANIAQPRASFESTGSADEFFDAAEGDAADRSQLLRIDNHSEPEESPTSEIDAASIHGSVSSSSSVGGDDEYTDLAGDAEGGATDGSNLFPPKPKSLTPLPVVETVNRRKTIPPSTVLPPSLIAFVRKNVGKDLSTISMPASANEPTSLLQRIAEQLEYAQLLNEAASKPRPEERLLYVAAFAVSQFSGGRAKERAIRKPFNPLLGETYELLRTEAELPGGGMRLLVEKVSHRPVRLAIQADANAWSFAQAAAPSQKFWGKSAEVITEGRVRVTLRLPDGGGEEHYSWTLATVFLRNVVMGEKYVEPVGTMAVTNDTTGARAAVEFRSKGMFGGRSEDVQIETFDPSGAHTGLSLTGNWTTSLRIADPRNKAGGQEIWRVGPLVDNAEKVYGMTQFAVALNEVTSLEKGKLAPTDCRLRPDQRLAEDGKLDEAEVWKTKLEEAQRTRRRQLEERGEQHKPRWFFKVATGSDGDEVWRLKGGKDGYWEERARGTWTGVEDIFADE